jgi:hypothetical protein
MNYAINWTTEELGLHSRQGQTIFLLSRDSIQALGPTKTAIYWVLMALSLEIEWSEHEIEHIPPSSAKVKNEWSYLHLQSPIQVHGIVLNLHWPDLNLWLLWHFQPYNVICTVNSAVLGLLNQHIN